MTTAPDQLLDVSEDQGVTVVRLCPATILEASLAQELGLQLYRFVEDLGVRKLVVDLAAVAYISADFLGKLIVLDQKMRRADGKLVLVSLHPAIYECLTITCLTKLFVICDTPQEGITLLT
ncbi:MAG: STAS domain-containing protein [Candidatus Andersenbacteria bacterium]